MTWAGRSTLGGGTTRTSTEPMWIPPAGCSSGRARPGSPVGAGTGRSRRHAATELFHNPSASETAPAMNSCPRFCRGVSAVGAPPGSGSPEWEFKRELKEDDSEVPLDSLDFIQLDNVGSEAVGLEIPGRGVGVNGLVTSVALDEYAGGELDERLILDVFMAESCAETGSELADANVRLPNCGVGFWRRIRAG